MTGIGPDRRRMLAGIGAGLLLPAAVRARAAADVVVSRSGGPGSVPTLAAALALAMEARRPFRIQLAPGVYEEKLTVTVPDVTIEGAGPDSIVSFGAFNAGPRPGGGTWGTAGSATLTLAAPGITLRRLTVRNSFDFIGARAQEAVSGSQGVALLVDRGADRTHILDCQLLGYQDTFYVQPRTLVERCRIVGGTDFVFGGAAALIRDCEIVSRFIPGADPQGYLAAPSTPATQPIGLVFDRCRLLREAGVPDGSVWLGRPWRAGGNMALTGSATFLRCWMDAHIRREGWTRMGYPGADGTRRFLTPAEARLREYGSRGPGAAPAGGDRRLLTAAEAARFTPAAILGDWRPSHG